jgi:pimeloyl-[acyl-carrier protein] methyl ester esterase
LSGLLVLLHGWGCDAAMWDRVVPLLPRFDVIRLDRGYFGAQRQCDRPDRACVAVGHSLGAMWLARMWGDVPLVAINGFDRFCGQDGVPSRVLARMQTRFAQTPGAVLDDFRLTVGAGPTPAMPSPQPLAEDLALLADDSAPPLRKAPLLVLQAQDDPLLPAALRDGTFGGLNSRSRADGGHMLPLTQPAWCAAQIEAFAR